MVKGQEKWKSWPCLSTTLLFAAYRLDFIDPRREALTYHLQRMPQLGSAGRFTSIIFPLLHLVSQYQAHP